MCKASIKPRCKPFKAAFSIDGLSFFLRKYGNSQEIAINKTLLNQCVVFFLLRKVRCKLNAISFNLYLTLVIQQQSSYIAEYFLAGLITIEKLKMNTSKHLKKTIMKILVLLSAINLWNS